ncbi:MAG: hypothetical protein BWY70_01469 [Bacteroidetes bacterium ADurb.Bin408]|nr:MAG: hypothetical protein BWY70_01469 [Bacteroidetes bacterium ADurb.Bin408]
MKFIQNKNDSEKLSVIKMGVIGTTGGPELFKFS